MIQVAFFTAYPGSPYHDRLFSKEKDKKEITRRFGNQDIKLSHYNIAGKPNQKELKKIQRDFYLNYYLSPSYLLTHIPQLFHIIINLKNYKEMIIDSMRFFKKKL
jgi:hypothetical protein